MQRADSASEPALPPDVAAHCIDEEYRQGYARGYEEAINAMMKRCEFLLARTAALADLRTFADQECAQVSALLDRTMLCEE